MCSRDAHKPQNIKISVQSHQCGNVQCCAWFPAEEEGKLEAVERWNAALAPLLKMHCAWESDVHKQLQVHSMHYALWNCQVQGNLCTCRPQHQTSCCPFWLDLRSH